MFDASVTYNIEIPKGKYKLEVIKNMLEKNEEEGLIDAYQILEKDEKTIRILILTTMYYKKPSFSYSNFMELLEIRAK